MESQKRLVASFWERALLSVFSVISGMLGLLCWNILLNLQVSIDFLWPGFQFNSSVLVCVMGASCFATVILTIKSQYTGSKALAAFSVVLLVVCMGLLMVPVFLYIDEDALNDPTLGYGTKTARTAELWVLSIATAMGLVGGSMQCQSFVFPNTFKPIADCVSLVPFGQSLIGVVLWGVVTVVQLYCPTDTVRGVQGTFVGLCSFASILALTYGLLFISIMRTPIFAALNKDASRKRKNSDYGRRSSSGSTSSIDEEQQLVTTGNATGKKNSWVIIQKVMYPAFRTGLALLTTLIAFPGIGPLMWPTTQAHVHIGIFCACDVIARFLCSYCAAVFLLSRLGLEVALYMRFFVLLPVFILPALRIPMWDGFMSQSWYLYTLSVVWVMSHGIIFSSACVSCMGGAADSHETDIFACVMTLFIVGMGFVGVMLSKIAIPIIARSIDYSIVGVPPLST